MSFRMEPPRTLPLWPGAAPGESASPHDEQFVPPPHAQDTIIRITDVTVPTLTVYRAVEGKDTSAALVICPGGGYSLLAWNLEGTEVAEWFSSIGVTAFLLKYRVPVRSGTPPAGPPIREPLQDAQRAIQLVRSQATAWGVDPQRIGILGFSAGGNLAAFACTEFTKTHDSPIDEIDQASCRPDFGVLIYPAWLVDYQSKKLRPEFNITGQTPPLFLVHAANDSHPCESSIELFLELRRVGVAGELHVHQTGGHGFGLRPRSDEPISGWPQGCADWMHRQGWMKE